ncbi:MAG TPA: NIPSNAP family protein [Acetobacteraceae bacterium]
MAVTVQTRWKGAKRADIERIGREAKLRMEACGAEHFGISLTHTGEHTGQWLVTVRYADWAAYAKAVEAIAADQRYQQLFAEASGIAEIMTRNVMIELDL